MSSPGPASLADESANASPFAHDLIYQVDICSTPACSCPDAAKGFRCKHISFVILQALGCPRASYIWHQPALLDTEVRQLLDGTVDPMALAPDAPVGSKRRREDVAVSEPAPALPSDDLPTRLAASRLARLSAASEVARELVDGGSASDDVVTAIARLPVESMRYELVEASLAHREVADALVLARASPLDAISDRRAAKILAVAASRWPAIAKRIDVTVAASQLVAEDVSFARDVRRIIHADDKLRESVKYERGFDTAASVGRVIGRVMEAIERCPTELQAERCMEALDEIAGEMLGADGETHKAMLGCGGAVIGLENALETMVDVLHDLDMLADFEDMYERIGRDYDAYGHEQISCLAARVKETLDDELGDDSADEDDDEA